MRLSEQEEPAAFYSEVRWEVEEAGTLQTNGEVLSATWSRVCVCVCVCVCYIGICEFVCVYVISKTSVCEQRVSPRVNRNGQGVSCVGAITHGVVQSVASGVLTKKGVNFSKTPWSV